jgi:uncharacterized membrane protein
MPKNILPKDALKLLKYSVLFIFFLVCNLILAWVLLDALHDKETAVYLLAVIGIVEAAMAYHWGRENLRAEMAVKRRLRLLNIILSATAANDEKYSAAEKLLQNYSDLSKQELTLIMENTLPGSDAHTEALDKFSEIIKAVS